MPKINKTKYAILGILNLKPSSGYDIKKYCDLSFSHYWNENFGSIYPMLKRMEMEGMVNKKTEQNEGKPSRIIYSITEKGKSEFDEWMLTPTEEKSTRRERLLKLAFANPREENNREIIMEMFERQKAVIQQKLDEYLQIENDIAKDDPLTETNGISLRVIALRCLIAESRAQIQWCEESVEAIKNMKSKSKNGRIS